MNARPEIEYRWECRNGHVAATLRDGGMPHGLNVVGTAKQVGDAVVVEPGFRAKLIAGAAQYGGKPCATCGEPLERKSAPVVAS